MSARPKEDLDAASADRITVEGDDELLSYAVNKAAEDPENQVRVETTGVVSAEGRAPPAPAQRILARNRFV